MFNTFSDYIYYLFTSPYKKVKKATNHFYVFSLVVGKVFDVAKDYIYLTREASIIISANELFLDEHGKDRNMPRFADEEVETYRTRLSMKAIIAESAGTRHGILIALKSLGFTQADIYAVRIFDPLRWAEFYVFIESDEIDLIKNFSIVKTIIRDVKPARSLPNYWFRVSKKIASNTIQSNRIITTIGDISNLSFSETKIIIKIDVKNSINLSNAKVKYGENMTFIDGSWNLDGSIILNAIINEEDL